MFLKIGQYYIREEAIANVSVTTSDIGGSGEQVEEVFIYYIGTNPADNRDHFSGLKAQAVAAYLKSAAIDVMAVQNITAAACTKIKAEINQANDPVSTEEFGRRLQSALVEGLPFGDEE